jgi:Tol biopolymer transport system component
LIAYCMTGQATWDDRVGKIDVEDNLQKIDLATGAASVVPAGPGVKEAPFPLASGDIGFLRRDKPKEGLFYAGGNAGPAGADIRFPSWSPDGKQVVYSRFKSLSQPNPAHMWSRNASLTFTAPPFLQTSSGMLSGFATTQRAGTGTELVTIENGKPARSILERPDLILAPQWSADGKQIVVGVGNFSSFLDFEVGSRKPVDPANGGAQVAILNDDGSSFKLLTSGPNNNGFPSFAPDGRRIVYRTAGPEGQGLRILSLADGSVTKLTGSWDNFPLWSPRGDTVAFVRRNDIGDFQIFTIHPDGTGLAQLSHTHGNDAHLAWSPDGEHLLFTSSRMGFKDEALYTGAPQPYGEIFVMRANGSEVEQLTYDQWDEGGPAWLPSLRKAASSSH